MLKFLGSYAVRILAVAVVLLAVLLYAQTKEVELLSTKLHNAEGVIAAQQAAIELMQQVAEEDEEDREVVRVVVEEIENAEGADTLVPTDVALAWAAGIDRLRDESGGGAAV